MPTREDLLPTYEHEHFDNQQLAVALVQVRFPTVARFADDRYMAGAKEALTEEYPLLTPTTTMNMVITPQGISQTPGGTALRFISLDRYWIVELSDSAVSLETRSYDGEIPDFSARFSAVLQSVVDHLRIRYQLRFGLRYVNEFRHPHGTTYGWWRERLNPDLLGMGARGVLGGAVEQTLGEVRTKRRDGMLLVRHGFLHGTTVVPTEPQLAKTGPFYLLDLDYYDETTKKLEIAGVANQMKEYSDVQYRLFRWAIGDGELYRYLRGGA
jgi:uncharacterized protein (TIGR04255 family)